MLWLCLIVFTQVVYVRTKNIPGLGLNTANAGSATNVVNNLYSNKYVTNSTTNR